MAPVTFTTSWLLFSLLSLPKVLAGPVTVRDTNIRDEALAAHNSARAAHGASPLNWNDGLAAASESWVDGCVFGHGGFQSGAFGGMPLDESSASSRILMSKPIENVSAGLGVTDGINSWVSEGYDAGDPFSHLRFSQIVWKSTTDVGCAITNCPDIGQFLACQYSPPGNVIGQFECAFFSHLTEGTSSRFIFFLPAKMFKGEAQV